MALTFKLYSKDQDIEEAVFMAVMYWRILYGSLRVFIGYKLLSLVGLPAITAYQHLLRRELSETHDAVFQLIGHLIAQHGFSITYFLASYLLFWGVFDIMLSISMLRHYLWAFTLSMGIMGLFIVYEIFRFFTHTHSPVLLAFILIDLFIISLIYHERGRLIERRARKLEKQRRNGGNARNSHEHNGEPANDAA